MNTVKLRTDKSRAELLEMIRACILSNFKWGVRFGAANEAETRPLDCEILYELMCEIDIFIRLTDAGWVPLKQRPEGEAELWHSQCKKAAQRYAIINDALLLINVDGELIPRIVKIPGTKEKYALAIEEYAGMVDLAKMKRQCDRAKERYDEAKPFADLVPDMSKKFLESKQGQKD